MKTTKITASNIIIANPPIKTGDEKLAGVVSPISNPPIIPKISIITNKSINIKFIFANLSDIILSIHLFFVFEQGCH